jgi:simple sugar transport system permease protein
MFDSLLNYLIGALGFSATLVYGATGEILSEKAGHLNLGIPGVMCMGGAGGCIMLTLVGQSELPHFLIVLLGILGAFTMAALMGLIYSFLTVTLRANQNVTGLTLTTLGMGLSKVLFTDVRFIDQNVYIDLPKHYFRFPFDAIEGLKYPNLLTLGVMFFLALVVAGASSFILYKTRVGLNLRAVGENPATADAAGINVVRCKYAATCIGCGIAGLGGLYYIIDFSASIEAYKGIDTFGWLSVALVIFALWKPHMTLPCAFIFGVLYTCSSQIPKIVKDTMPGVVLPLSLTPILRMLPYLFTILMLILSSVRNKRENQPPASLGLSYFREDR